MKIDIKDCKSCPFRREEESHGPCDSYYYSVCSQNGKQIQNEDKILKTKFPRWCPLNKAER